MSATVPTDPRPITPFGRRSCAVIDVDRVGAYTVLAVDDPGPAPAPGQFSMLAAVDRWGAGEDERPYLPRAFSVMRRRGRRSEYLLEDVGPGTRRLCELRPGDQVWVLGPLGEGFTAPPPGAVALLVGGGVGIAPLAILRDALDAESRRSVTVLGFRDAAHAAGGALLDGAQIATDDGSIGYRGLVTDLLAGALDADPDATVYACGPPAMLEAVRTLCATRGTPSQLALEAGMACGYGACFGCAVPLAAGGYARVCLDGPVFAGAILGPIAGHG